jgi:hypothetical protein
VEIRRSACGGWSPARAWPHSKAMAARCGRSGSRRMAKSWSRRGARIKPLRFGPLTQALRSNRVTGDGYRWPLEQRAGLTLAVLRGPIRTVLG